MISRAPITPETVDHACAVLGRVDTETPDGPRVLMTAEELDGECPRRWIEGQRRAMGLVAPWDCRTLGLEYADPTYMEERA